MGCAGFLVKYILFIVNLIFALAGLTLLGLGIATQLKISVIINLTDASLHVAPIFSMVTGGIVFLIAFFGCCGAIRESNCMLVTYSIFLLILMLVKLVLAIMLFIDLDGIVAEVPTWLEEIHESDTSAFHDIEGTFHCCGTSGPQSYLDGNIPPSCCAGGGDACTDLNLYPGCNGIVVDFFRTFGTAIGVFAVVVVLIELLAAVLGFCLANRVRNKSSRYIA